MQGARGDIRIQLGVLVVGALLMGIKFLAWHITGSEAILADALESIVNVAAGTFALYSLVLATKPRDLEHPYGHGKVEFISAGIEGALITVAGGAIIVRGVLAFMAGNELHRLGEGIALTAVAGAVNLGMGLLLRHRGRRHHSPTLAAGGTHLISDAWSTVAMLGGLLLIMLTGRTSIDSLFAVAFGLFITHQGVRVLRRAVAGIMDETDMDTAREVIGVLEKARQPDWVDLHNFRVVSFGRALHIDCHVTLPWYYSLERAHQEIEAMEKLVNERGDRPVELFIHMDPCVPSSCSICALKGCPERRAAFHHRVTWDLESALLDKKHGGP